MVIATGITFWGMGGLYRVMVSQLCCSLLLLGLFVCSVVSGQLFVDSS